MLPILNRRLITLLLLVTFQNSYGECLQGEIRYIYQKKEFKESSHYCFNATKTSLTSKSCEQQECLKGLAKVKFSYHGVGTPGFTLCQKYGGKPQILEFKVKDQWYALDRCQLKNGYIDTGSLIKFNQTY